MSSGTDLTSLFPQLEPGTFSITSPADREYNCHAWSAGDDTSWWSPTNPAGQPIGGYYWPRGVSRDDSLPSHVAAFGSLGYELCDNAELEPAVEKIAIYVNGAGLPTHSARQLADGQWTSKIGTLHDITHDTLSGLEGAEYGRVACVMRRALPDRH